MAACLPSALGGSRRVLVGRVSLESQIQRSRETMLRGSPNHLLTDFEWKEFEGDSAVFSGWVSALVLRVSTWFSREFGRSRDAGVSSRQMR